MNATELREVLLASWADPPEVVGQRIFRYGAALPMLCADLQAADAKRCAAIVLDIVRRRGPRGRKKYAVCLQGTAVVLRREDDAELGTVAGYVSRLTDAETLEALISGKHAVDRERLTEVDGWNV